MQGARRARPPQSQPEITIPIRSHHFIRGSINAPSMLMVQPHRFLIRASISASVLCDQSRAGRGGARQSGKVCRRQVPERTDAGWEILCWRYAGMLIVSCWVTNASGRCAPLRFGISHGEPQDKGYIHLILIARLALELRVAFTSRKPFQCRIVIQFRLNSSDEASEASPLAPTHKTRPPVIPLLREILLRVGARGAAMLGR